MSCSQLYTFSSAEKFPHLFARPAQTVYHSGLLPRAVKSKFLIALGKYVKLPTSSKAIDVSHTKCSIPHSHVRLYETAVEVR